MYLLLRVLPLPPPPPPPLFRALGFCDVKNYISYMALNIKGPKP